MLMDVLKKALIVLTLGIWASSVFLLLSDLEPDQRSSLFDSFKNETTETTFNLAMTVIGYDLSTPAFRPCRSFAHNMTNLTDYGSIDGSCFGDPDKMTFMIEDIPFPDSKDMIFLVPYLLFAYFISRLVWKLQNLKMAWKILIILMLFIVGVPLIWIIMHSILYSLMLSSSDALHIQPEIIATRETVIASTYETQAIMPLIFLTVISAVIMFFSLWPSNRQ